MSEMYVVIYEWCDDQQADCRAVGIYTTKEKASKALDDYVAWLKSEEDSPLNSYDTENYDKGERYEGYTEGRYLEGHDNLFIEKLTVDQDIKTNSKDFNSF